MQQLARSSHVAREVALRERERELGLAQDVEARCSARSPLGHRHRLLERLYRGRQEALRALHASEHDERPRLEARIADPLVDLGERAPHEPHHRVRLTCES
jgi:hypothetical protein